MSSRTWSASSCPHRCIANLGCRQASARARAGAGARGRAPRRVVPQGGAVNGSADFREVPEASVFGVKPGGDAPAYLDGSMLGDQGLDPLCLIALADPKLTPDAILKLDQLARSPAARKEKVAAMSAEEQQGAL